MFLVEFLKSLKHSPNTRERIGMALRTSSKSCTITSRSRNVTPRSTWTLSSRNGRTKHYTTSPISGNISETFCILEDGYFRTRRLPTINIERHSGWDYHDTFGHVWKP